MDMYELQHYASIALCVFILIILLVGIKPFMESRKEFKEKNKEPGNSEG